MSDNSSALVTVTATNFMADVVEASAQIPVLVDFWAPWCGPCKQLMPVLDRLAEEYGGSFKLAKVNTDEEQELAQKVGIRSLPTVVLFKDRTAVEHFVGIVPESQIRALLDKHLPKKSDGPAARVAALKAAGDYVGARALLEAQLAKDATNISLQTDIAELHALEGDLDVAQRTLEQLRAKEPNHAAVKRLTALLEFSKIVAANPDVRALKERANSNPQDLDVQHALAVHQLLGGDVEPALQTWLEMMRSHSGHKDNLGRRSLVHAFEMIGESDPIVGQTRRAMARMLF